MKNKSEVILSEIINSFSNCFKNLDKKPFDISVALSGGVDSIVLLHALSQIQKQLKLKLSAIHIHHDLSPNADDWLTFCYNECQKLNITIKSEKINIKKARLLALEKQMMITHL